MALVPSAAVAASKLSSLLTETAFEELSLAEYSRKLKLGLQDLLETCRMSPPSIVDQEDEDGDSSCSAGLVKYDPLLLRRNLNAALPWKHLCRKYDERYMSRRKAKKEDGARATTCFAGADAHQHRNAAGDPLTVVLHSLLDPTIWPSCCTQTVVEALLEVGIFQLTNRNTPSRRYLVDDVITNQFLRHLPSLLTNLGPFLSGLIARLHTVDPAGKALLSLLQQWCTEFPVHRASWLTLLLELSVRCELLEQDLKVQQQQHRQMRTLSVARNQFDIDSVNVKVRRESRSTGFNMQCLHGELSDDEEEALAKSVARKKISYSSVRPPRTANTGIKDLPQNSTVDVFTGTNPGDLLLNLWKFRAKCLRALIFMSRTTAHAWSTGGGIPRCPQPVGTVLQLILKAAEQVPYSSSTSIRLCAILLAQTDMVVDERTRAGTTKDTTFFETFLGYVWSKALSPPVDNVSLFYFRFAMELLSECSHFDNLERLQKAVGPLFQHLHTITTAELLLSSCDESNRSSNSPGERGGIKSLLRCFAYLLSRRGRMLLSDPKTKPPNDADADFHRGLTSLLQHLSVSFGRISDWVDASDLSVERDNIVHSLQAAGILGMGVVDGDALNNNKCSFSAWNTHIRSAAQSMEAWMDIPFFSEFSQSNAIPPSLVARDAARSSKRHSRQNLSSDAATVNDLDDNLLQNVFSFLSYKRVTAMRAVCSTWKENADANHLWQFLYDNKYCTRSDDPVLQTTSTERAHLQNPSVHINWRNVFADRWHAGREIRFRYARTDPTWKFRICNYVGCLHVLSSPAQLKQHYKSHRRQQTKKRKPSKSAGCGSKKRIRPS